MTQDELNKILNDDNYHQERKNPSDSDLRLFLREVNYHCPLCGKELQHKKQKKTGHKLFEIAHIYPNRPTIQQYETLSGLERLGMNSEDFDNKIALCKDCHSEQDYLTSKEDYIKLLEIKKRYITSEALEDVSRSINLEEEIRYLIDRLKLLSSDELSELSYDPVPIANKFNNSEILLKTKVKGYIIDYYPLIQEYLKKIDGKDGFHLEILSGQIKSIFIKMNDITTEKTAIFDKLVEIVCNKTQSQSKEACEAIISFFIQNCEVFYEIPE